MDNAGGEATSNETTSKFQIPFKFHFTATVTGCLGVNTTDLEPKTPFLALRQAEIEEKLHIAQPLCDLEALQEHPVPSTSGITSVGNTNHFSAHGQV